MPGKIWSKVVRLKLYLMKLMFPFQETDTCEGTWRPCIEIEVLLYFDVNGDLG